MTTCHLGASLENMVECVQNIYPPYLLCILKSALCEQHILHGRGQTVCHKGGTHRKTAYLVAVQQCKQVLLEGSEGAGGMSRLSGHPEGNKPLLYLEREGDGREERGRNGENGGERRG